MRIQIFLKSVTDSSDTSIIDRIQNDYSNYQINKKKTQKNSAIFTKQNYRTSLLNSPTIICPKIIEMQIIELSYTKLSELHWL